MKNRTTTRLAELERQVETNVDPERWSLPLQVIDLDTGAKIGGVRYLPRPARVDYRNGLHLLDMSKD